MRILEAVISAEIHCKKVLNTKSHPLCINFFFLISQVTSGIVPIFLGPFIVHIVNIYFTIIPMSQFMAGLGYILTYITIN